MAVPSECRSVKVLPSIFQHFSGQLTVKRHEGLHQIARSIVGHADRRVKVEALGIDLVELHIIQDSLREEGLGYLLLIKLLAEIA